MPLAKTIKEFVSFMLKGVDLIDHTSIFLLRTIKSLRNSYNVYTFMIRSNQNRFRAFPTRVSPALRYPNKVVRYSAGLRTTSDQI